MHLTIRDGEVITVEFVEPRDVKRGDILLYRSAKRVFAHRVVAITRTEQRGLSNEQEQKNWPGDHSVLSPQHSSLITSFILRGDASSTCDAPVESGQVLGKVVAVERNGREIAVNSIIAKVTHHLRACAFRVARRRGIKPISHFVRRLPVPLVARSG